MRKIQEADYDRDDDPDALPDYESDSSDESDHSDAPDDDNNSDDAFIGAMGDLDLAGMDIEG